MIADTRFQYSRRLLAARIHVSLATSKSIHLFG